MSTQWDDFQRAIAEADDRIERDRAAMHMLVTQARFAGVPWSVIGASLGISRQAAHKKFGSTSLAH